MNRRSLPGGFPDNEAFRLRWPVAAPRITQGWGEHPEVYRAWGLPGHEGIDFGCPVGTPILAGADGVVSLIAEDGGKPASMYPYGNQIRLQHQNGLYTTVHAHLSEVRVALGQQVRAGDVIGLSGNTGNSTGPHLHWSLKKKGSTAAGSGWPSDLVNPMPYIQK